MSSEDFSEDLSGVSIREILKSMLFFQLSQERSREGYRQVFDVVHCKGSTATRPRVPADKQ